MKSQERRHLQLWKFQSADLAVISLAAVLFGALPAPLGWAGECDETVPQNLFQDGTKEGKEAKPKPPHRLIPPPCKGCEDLFKDLQRALDDCYALELQDADKSLNDSIQPPAKTKAR